ncbi:MAG: GDSL-type esterase/lipase family protein [Vicinamibacterales bacterium]
MRALVRSLPRFPALIVGIAGLLLLVDDWIPDNAAIDTELMAAVLCFAIGATAVVVLVSDWIEPRRLLHVAQHGAKGAAVTVVALAISLVAAEYLARWVYRDITTTGDDRGYFSRRWDSSGAAVFNAQGFRERTFVEAKPPATYRIAVVGDSFTYASGLDAKDRFTEVLQQKLPSRMEVLNFGVPGNNTPQHAANIRKNVLRLAPDFILVQWFVNDVEGERPAGRPTFSNVMPIAALHERLYRSSALYSLMNIRWTQMQAEWTGGTYEQYLTKRFGDPQGDGARADRDAMLALAEVCRRAHVKFGFVLFPDSGFDLGARYPLAFLHDRELAFCADQQITCVDLRPALAQVPDRRKLWVNRLDHHPSALANGIAAMEILKAFEAEWMTIS